MFVAAAVAGLVVTAQGYDNGAGLKVRSPPPINSSFPLGVFSASLSHLSARPPFHPPPPPSLPCARWAYLVLTRHGEASHTVADIPPAGKRFATNEASGAGLLVGMQPAEAGGVCCRWCIF